MLRVNRSKPFASRQAAFGWGFPSVAAVSRSAEDQGELPSLGHLWQPGWGFPSLCPVFLLGPNDYHQPKGRETNSSPSPTLQLSVFAFRGFLRR